VVSEESKSAGTSEKPKRKPRVRTVLPIETLADAWALSQVEGLAKAAQTYCVHPETIRRAGARIAADEALRAKAEAKRQELADEWRPQAMRVLRAGLNSLEKLFEQAKPDQLRDVAGAVHLLAEKIIAVDAIPNVRRNLQTPNQGQKASAPRVGSSGGAVRERAGNGAGEPAVPPASPTGVH
jgi:hypothetical protein